MGNSKESPEIGILTKKQVNRRAEKHKSNFTKVKSETAKDKVIYFCECGQQAEMVCVCHPMDGAFWGVETPHCPECDEKPTWLGESIAVDGNCYEQKLKEARKAS